MNEHEQQERIRVVHVYRPAPQRSREAAPCIYIEIPVEGRLRGGVRGVPDREAADRVLRQAELDPEVAALLRMARRIRDRQAA